MSEPRSENEHLRERIAEALYRAGWPSGAERYPWPTGPDVQTKTCRQNADAVITDLGMVRESKVRWEWPDIPEGWRYCDNQTLTNDGRMFRTSTAAPRDESPYDHEHQHLEARRFDDERWVTPWADHSGREARDE